MELLQALKSLDVTNDDHWTGAGSPKMDIVKELTGNSELTRDDVTTAAPGLSRTDFVFLDIPESEEDREEVLEMIEDDIDSLKAKLDQYNQKVVDAQLAVADAQKAQKEAEDARDALLDKLQEVEPTMSNTEQIRYYLESQQQQRAERALRSKNILQAIGADALAQKSPLDQALGAKNTRPKFVVSKPTTESK